MIAAAMVLPLAVATRASAAGDHGNPEPNPPPSDQTPSGGGGGGDPFAPPIQLAPSGGGGEPFIPNDGNPNGGNPGGGNQGPAVPEVPPSVEDSTNKTPQLPPIDVFGAALVDPADVDLIKRQAGCDKEPRRCELINQIANDDYNELLKRHAGQPSVEDPDRLDLVRRLIATKAIAAMSSPDDPSKPAFPTLRTVSHSIGRAMVDTAETGKDDGLKAATDLTRMATNLDLVAR